jgi:hypothetical protein
VEYAKADSLKAVRDSVRRARNRPPMTEAARAANAEQTTNVVLVDGSNVAHSTEGEAARLANLLAIRDKLRRKVTIPSLSPTPR